MVFNEEDYLSLSGIQHFAYCQRQWALIHIEQQWQEDINTVEGSLMHKNVDNEGYREKRKGLLIIRSLNIKSSNLGLSGKCDVVEFRKDPDGINLINTAGRWIPYPVEYKHGKRKLNQCDRLQLCAETICLEEMLACGIKEGALYYGKEKHREIVEFTDELRREVQSISNKMHDYYQKGYTPSMTYSKKCENCSLKDLCVPKLSSIKSVKKYIEYDLEERNHEKNA